MITNASLALLPAAPGCQPQARYSFKHSFIRLENPTAAQCCAFAITLYAVLPASCAQDPF